MKRLCSFIKKLFTTSETKDFKKVVDDHYGYKELYQHRNELWITLCKCFNPMYVWRTTKHHDGSYYPGYFILGYRMKMGKQITYYLPMELWERCDFAKTRERAPRYDNHTPDDIISRLHNLR